MKVVLLLLLLPCVCVCMGTLHRIVYYGDKAQFSLGYRSTVLKFYPVDGRELIIWEKSGSQNNSTQRGKRVGSNYEIYNVTYQDSGTYKVMGRFDINVATYCLKVEALAMSNILAVNESSNYTFQLDKNACNINVIPFKSGEDPSKIVLVHNGQLQRGSLESFCEALEYKEPCQILMNDATTSCSGRYEIKDNLGNLAYSMELNVLSNIIHLLKDFEDTFKIAFDSRAYSLSLFYSGGGKEILLWSASNTQIPTKYRGGKIGRHYVINYLTYKDEGIYVVKDKAGRHVIAYSLGVEAKKLCLDSNLEERFEYSFNLVKDECSISFIQKKDGQEVALLNLVDKGRQQMANLFFCDGLKYVEPCMIYMTSAITSCSGRFEVKDSNGNLAYSLELSIVSPFNVSAFVISIIVIGPILLSCIKFCCCTKPPTKNTEDAADADESSQNYNEEHEREPIGNNSRPCDTPYLVQPHSSLSPLIHNTTVDPPPAYSEIFNPMVDAPPAYSEVSAPANRKHSSSATVSCDHSPPPPCDSTVPFSGGPTAPLSSVNEPRFEVEGLNISSASPLRSDSTVTDVYISDQLNFL